MTFLCGLALMGPFNKGFMSSKFKILQSIDILLTFEIIFKQITTAEQSWQVQKFDLIETVT